MVTMSSFTLTYNRLSRLIFIGFRGRRARQMKCFLICQWLLLAVLLYIWITVNGGLVPSFVHWNRQQSAYKGTLGVNLLDYFMTAGHDGIMISWAHSVNSRESLKQALYGDAMMLEADVILIGDNQRLTPAMAHLPDFIADFMLTDWLSLVKSRGKGIKLDFMTIDAVEIALEKLLEIHDELQVPLQLNAVVIDGSNDVQLHQTVIDSERFLHICTTRLPDCTLSLSWLVDQRTDRYNWTSIKGMHDLIERWHVQQPVTFTVRANLACRSMPQLRWLMEMIPGSTLTLVSTSLSDAVTIDELLCVRQRLPKHAVFYDIPLLLWTQFIAVKDDVSHHKQLALEESEAFVADQWKVVRSHDGETIYLGTEAVVLKTGLLLTKASYEATRHHPVIITGRVEFFNSTTFSNDLGNVIEVPTANNEIGFVIFIRALQSSRPDSISGIRCFFGAGGELRLELHKVPGVDGQSQTVLPGTSPCIAFRIIDHGTGGIEMHASRPKTCNCNFNVVRDVDFEAKLRLSLDSVTTEGSYVAIKQSIPVGFVAVDKFAIHTQRSVKLHL